MTLCASNEEFPAFQWSNFFKSANILFCRKRNNLEIGRPENLCRGFHAFRSSIFQMVVFCFNERRGMLVQRFRRKALPSKSGRLN